MKYLLGTVLTIFLAFGVTQASYASETEACLFGLLECDQNGLVWGLETVTSDSQLAQLTQNDGAAEVLLRVGYFLARQILPLLIFIAFFLFLFYLARAFIFDVNNPEDRDEAKTRALWGFAAFILISSLWGIVNLLVGGLNIDRERSICPDYLGTFCGNLGFERGVSTYDGGSDIDFGSGPSIPGVSPDTGTGNNQGGAIAEMLFGQYEDNASFNFRTGAPRATTSVVTLSPNATCLAGIQTLQTAAGIESLQSGYLLYKSNNVDRWLNITDATEQTAITFDAEFMQPELTTSEKVALVHTHPQITIEELGLQSSGHPPSVSDQELLCDDVANDALFVTVDENQVWTLESTANTCPRRASEREALPVISTLLHLSVINAAQRNTAFQEIFTWDDLPFSMRSDLSQYDETDFNALSITEIVTLADDIARSGGMRITRQTAADFCASF